MDVYHRLHAREDEFFIPYDLEISNVELSYVCKKAEQFRGEEGERRKAAVYDYIWEEEQVWPTNPHIKIQILLTVFSIFRMVPAGRICLEIKTFYLW